MSITLLESCFESAVLLSEPQELHGACTGVLCREAKDKNREPWYMAYIMTLHDLDDTSQPEWLLAVQGGQGQEQGVLVHGVHHDTS